MTIAPLIAVLLDKPGRDGILGDNVIQYGGSGVAVQPLPCQTR